MDLQDEEESLDVMDLQAHLDQLENVELSEFP